MQCIKNVILHLIKFYTVRNIVWTTIVVWFVWKIYNVFSNKANNNTNTSQKSKEGETKIEKNVLQKPHFKPNDGEYVDYEEVN